MEILNFTFESGWHFAGMCILILLVAALFSSIAECIVAMVRK